MDLELHEALLAEPLSASQQPTASFDVPGLTVLALGFQGGDGG